MSNDIKANLMRSSDIKYLAEGTMMEATNEAELEEAASRVASGLSSISGEDASGIIEFRNADPNGRLADADGFVEEGMRRFASPFIKKSVTLKEAVDLLFRMNKATGKEYAIEDILIDPRRDSKNGETVIVFESTASSKFKEMESRLTYMAEACHDCLYEDLFDADTLREYLPVLYLFAR
jgi:hypothetical protein